jgi:hypothetical protein
MKKTAKPDSEPIAAAPAPAGSERQSMIELAAYFLYEKSGCDPGRALEHWLQAEAQIDEQLQRSATPRKAPAVKARAAKPATGKPAARKPVALKVAPVKAARKRPAKVAA